MTTREAYTIDPMRLAGLFLLSVLVTQEAQFRGGVELVTVDVHVIGSDGRALLGLGRDDFTLKVDGTTRPVRSMQLVRVGRSGNLASGSSSPTSSQAASAQHHTVGRTLILVFDHEHIRPSNERAAIQGATNMLDRLDPGDRVALVTLPNGRIEVNLTSHFEEIRRALPRVVGRDHDVPGGIMKPAIGCAFTALLDFIAGLRSLDGPKTIVFVSEGFGCSQPIRSRMDDKRDLEDLASLSAAARTQFYVVQPNNAMLIDASRKLPTGLPEADIQNRDKATNTLEDIAGVTGGDFFRLSGTADAVFERVLRETAAYYELAFEPLESERNGKDHSISIRVNRPKVTVRARPSFSINSHR